ncbi:MAG: choice-of-anchor F family protein [Pseudomonadota bacterium]
MAASVAALSAGSAQATQIVSGTAGWNLDNIAPGETLPDGTETNDIYDQIQDANPGADGNTYGRVLVDAPEGVFQPGIKVMNGSAGGLDEFGEPTTIEDNTSNCIMASGTAYCDGPRQTGKRWKQQITGAGGPMDLVFNVDPSTAETDPGTGEVLETEYRAFHRLINATGEGLAGFKLELGFGVGDDFVASAAGDGIRVTPRDDQNPTQFPFGLFGEDLSVSDSGRLGGFFDPTGRALFDTTFEEDSITTGALRGLYDDFFGPSWMPGDAVPEGVFYDHDNDDSTEALVMAWLREDGLWEQRREFVDGEVRPVEELLSDPLADLTGTEFADLTLENLPMFDTLSLGDLEGGVIEDLANLNLNYALFVGDTSGWGSDTFTLRVTAAAGTAPVPVPAALPLLGAAVGGLALMRRRRKAA